MAGLNDNFLLADDSLEPNDTKAVTIKAFKDDTADGEVPELRDDIDFIAIDAQEALSAVTEEFTVRLRDLELLTQNIKNHGGMSQSIALEAQAILPDFINENRPIEYFTKMPSRTLLSVALEEVAADKKSVIQRMIEAVKKFIENFLARIKKLFDGKTAEEKQAELKKKIEARADQIKEKNKHLEKEAAEKERYETIKEIIGRIPESHRGEVLLVLENQVHPGKAHQLCEEAYEIAFNLLKNFRRLPSESFEPTERLPQIAAEVKDLIDERAKADDDETYKAVAAWFDQVLAARKFPAKEISTFCYGYIINVEADVTAMRISLDRIAANSDTDVKAEIEVIQKIIKNTTSFLAIANRLRSAPDVALRR